MISAEAARERLDELLDSPDRLARLRRLYVGDGDVLVVLQSIAHPASRGGTDPDADLETLARRAFSRSATPSDLAVHASAVDARARRLAALERALREFDAESTAVRDDPTDDGAAGIDSEPGPRRINGGRGLAIAAICLLVAANLALVGAVLSSTDVTTTIRSLVDPTGRTALDRFEAAQSTDDAPEVRLPVDIDPATTRRLLPQADGRADPDSDYVAYGARSDRSEVCLLLALPRGEIAASCVSDEEFAERGVSVSTNVPRPSSASLGSTILVAHTVRWHADDTLEFASSSPDTAS